MIMVVLPVRHRCPAAQAKLEPGIGRCVDSCAADRMCRGLGGAYGTLRPEAWSVLAAWDPPRISPSFRKTWMADWARRLAT